MHLLRSLLFILLYICKINCDTNCMRIRQEYIRQRLNKLIGPNPGVFGRIGHPNEKYNQSVGSKITFTCNSITYTGKPDLAPFTILKWFHDNKELQPIKGKSKVYGCRKRPFITGTRLNLVELDKKDAGRYTCGLYLENSTQTDLKTSIFSLSFNLNVFSDSQTQHLMNITKATTNKANVTLEVVQEEKSETLDWWVWMLAGLFALCIIIISFAVITTVSCTIRSKFFNKFQKSKNVPDVTWTKNNASQVELNDDQIQKQVEYVNDKCYNHLFPYISSIEWEMLRKNQVDRNSVTCGVEFSMPVVLGTGHFGHVYMGEITLKDGSTRKVAVKRLNDGYKPKELGHFLMEAITLLKAGKHCNVISIIGSILLDAFTDEENALRKPPILLMELASGGNLKAYLEERRVSTPEIPAWEEMDADSLVGKEVTCKDLTSFCYQVSRGMEHLSNRKIIHRDLAARNVLLTHDNIIKIADFGLSKHIRSLQSEYYRMHSPSLAPAKWTAPESLLENKFSIKSDVWSYGVLLWEIFTMGSQPYQHIPVAQLYRRLSTGLRLEKPEFANRKTYKIMKKCWAWDPENRPNFQELGNFFDSSLSSASLPYVELNDLKQPDFNSTNSETYVTMNSDIGTDSVFGYNGSMASTIPISDSTGYGVSIDSCNSEWTLDLRQEFVQLLNPIYEENNSNTT